MNNKTNQMIPQVHQLGLAVLLATSAASHAQTIVGASGEHVDAGIAYDSIANQWELHVHDESNDVEYFPATDARLFIGAGALTTVPGGAQWSFLGSAGSSTSILPNTPTAGLMLLGFGADEIEPGVFSGDQFTLSLKAVNGPGTFAVFDLDAFNSPVVLLNSGDGISGADSFNLPVGAHMDVNWAFSAPGDYTVTLEASGVSTANGPTASGDGDFHFRVEAVPEPAAAALAGAGALAWVLVRRNRRD